MKSLFTKPLVLLVGLGLVLTLPSTRSIPNAKAQTVDEFNSAAAYNSLISNEAFIDLESMSAAAIQAFLIGKNSYLQYYSENGRSAAQIIYDAAHGSGEAAGSINGITVNSATGTVSPKVLLVNLQKEQSLITKTTRDDYAIVKAMGYACPDGGATNDNNSNGCNDSYEGFAKQIENAAWQLRYNYEAAKLGESWWNQYYANQEKYYVGQTKTFSDYNGDHTVTLSNAATASLYRYTPHVFNGNYNFWNLMSSWFEYNFIYVSQSGFPTLALGEAAQFSLNIRNSGKTTWTQDTVRLGTDRARDRISSLLRESGDGSPYPSGWVWENRIKMQESSVAPGEMASFVFWLQAQRNLAPGVYREYFRPVVDGITWMEDYGIYWDVTVLNPAQTYSHSLINQSDYRTIQRGQAAQFSLTVRNTGHATWIQDVVHLGTNQARDRISSFLRESGDGSPYPSGWVWENRIKMQESSVAPGENATFVFWMQATSGMTPGVYREYFRLVADGITWMEDYGIYWNVTVN